MEFLVFAGFICAVAMGFGAYARYRLDRALSPYLPQGFSIAVVNFCGAALLGLLMGIQEHYPYPGFLEASDLEIMWDGLFFAATLTLGGFTTFSTAVLDVWDLLAEKKYVHALLLLVGGWLIAALAFCTVYLLARL